MCCLSDTRRPQNLNKCVYMEKLIPRGRRTFHLSIYEQLSLSDTDMTHMWPRNGLRNGTDQDMAPKGLGQTRTWTRTVRDGLLANGQKSSNWSPSILMF